MKFCGKISTSLMKEEGPHGKISLSTELAVKTKNKTVKFEKKRNIKLLLSRITKYLFYTVFHLNL
jgi:hypothetical protein